MMQDFIKPVLALSLICLVMAGALALVNNVTAPIILEAAAERAAVARLAIIPEANEFILIENDNFPLNVVEAFTTTNNVGYIFVVNSRGFGGTMRIMVGIAPGGNIIRSEILAQEESPGFADRVSASVDAAGGNILYVDAVSGATVTFGAYKGAVEAAFEAFEIIRRGN